MSTKLPDDLGQKAKATFGMLKPYVKPIAVKVALLILDDVVKLIKNRGDDARLTT